MIQIDMDMPKSCAVCRFNSRCASCECKFNHCTATEMVGVDGVQSYIAPPEDRRQTWCPLEEQKRGYWWHYEEFLICSACGTRFDDGIMVYIEKRVPKFCPNCGARMKENDDGKETGQKENL